MFRYVNTVNNDVILNVNAMGFFALQAILATNFPISLLKNTDYHIQKKP